LPSTSETSQAAPSILAEDVWVGFLIRYYRREVTLRETLVHVFDWPRGRGRGNGRWREAFWALRGINLAVHPGETIGIIGPNGSGKTTLLKTLAGILGADRGRVTVRGRVGCLLSFGVGFNAALSGRENVYLNGSILGMSRKMIDERFDRIVEMSELRDFINAPVRTYSAGMRGRLGFSIAVHIDPDVLMLDEVLGVGDAAFRAKAGTILEHLRRENKTVVIASHDVNLIREQCSRAVWLEGGRIRLEGAPAEVTDAYLKSARRPAAPAGGPNHAG
jgi:lipopolysaccharide transport system ATP-binding protein